MPDTFTEHPVFSDEDVQYIATVVHYHISGYRLGIGQLPLTPWADLSQNIRDGYAEGVRQHLEDPDRRPDQAHEDWMAYRLADGWVWGEVKDEAAKTHPDLVPYDQLPEAERVKNDLFRACVHEVMAMLEKMESGWNDFPTAVRA